MSVDLQALDAWTLFRNYIKQNPTQGIVVAAITLFYPVESILIPTFIMKFTEGLRKGDSALVVKYLSLFAVLFSITVGVNVIDLKFSEEMEVSIQAYIIQSVTSFIFNYKKIDIDVAENGKMIITVKMFAHNMSSYIHIMRYRIIPYTLSLVFQSVYLCTIDPILGLLTLVITLSIIGTTFLSIPKCEIPNSMVEQIDSNIFESIDEVLLNFGTIVDNATCKDEMQILQDLGKSAVELRGKAVNCSLSQSGLMFGQTAVYAVFFIWRLMHIRDKQNVEASVAALTVLLQVLDTSKTMIYYIDSISKVSANLTVNRDLIIAFVTKQLSEVSSESALDERAPPSSSAAIELRNVTFAYVNQKPIFENLNLSFEKNKCTIVHGPNGTGKSTILKLLTRYLTPTKGQLYIHGDSYSSQSPDRIRGQIAHCTQNPILFNRSVADNMLYGVEGVDRSELESRLTDMGLADFVGNLRQGLDTIVGKRGTNISGGQRQVVQLVRCLLQNKPILLLDEATSAVDSANRQLILQLINLAADKTVIFVTHDPEIIASYPSTSVVNLAAASEN